ncbi:MAG: GldG family protein [Verrucomicrobiae bacterium]|nr:GldG family protein [Verrucomicrobiae bacterium]
MPELEDPATPAKSIARFSIGVNVIVQVVLGVFLFGVVNYLSWRTYKRWDLTIGQSHTLSERTIGFLESMDKRARMIVLFTKGTQLTSNVHDLVDEYKRYAGKKLKVEIIDPAREPNRLEQIKEEYKMQFADRKDGVLIAVDGADDKPRTKFVDEDAFFTLDPSTGRTTAFTGESALTSALLAVGEGRRRVLKLVTGKGGLNLGGQGGTAMDFLVEFARKENAEVQTIDISDPNADFKDTDVLVFVNIKDDLTDEEVRRVRDYWETKRGSMLVLLNPEFPTPNLHALLKEYGVVVRNDRVLEMISGPRPLTGWEVTSVITLNASVTDQLLWGRNVKFRGKTQSLEIDHLNEEELRGRGIVVEELLQSDDRRFWGETDYLQDPPVYDEKTDSRRGPVTGVYVEKGVMQDAKLRVESSRMVVLGNSTMLDPPWDTASYDLGTSAINWMLDRDELVGIAPKQKQWFRLEISNAQSERIFQIIILALPLSVVCFGLFVWSVRRA